MKKIIALMLLCLLLCAVSVQAFASDSLCNATIIGSAWQNVTFSPVEVEEAGEYGFFYASESQKITVTPKNGYTITKLEVRTSDSDASEQITLEGSGYSFTMPDSSVDIFLEVARTDGGSIEHRVNVISAGGGSPVADKSMAAVGETVTITPNPEPGNVLEKIQLEYSDDTGMENYQDVYVPYFTMPNHYVTAVVYYKMGSDTGNPTPPKPQYNVSVEVDPSEGGSVSVSKNKAEEGDMISISVNPAEDYELNELKAFAGNDEIDITNHTFVMPAGDVEVKAAFTKIPPRNKVYFDANGGNCATASAEVNAGNRLAQLPKATRKDYVLKGWFTASVDGDAVTTDTVFDQPETTVYAQWIEAAHTTDPEKNDFGADIALEDSEVLDRLINADDRQKNENIIVYLTVKESEESEVAAVDKDAIMAMAGSDRIAAYLDINLFKKIGNEEAFLIHNTGDAVPITLKLPDTLIPENAVKDSFYIIYYHGNQAKSIPAAFNTTTKVLTFNAKEFSTYSLVYKTQNTENVDVSMPETGDNSMRMDFLFAVMLISLIGLRLVGRKRIN